jgi:N,N-dimethylformamidase
MMNLTGYSDRWSVRPGETIGFHIHCGSSHYDGQIVRLRHGDESPRGPGFKESPVSSPLDGRYAGSPRTIRPGSWAEADLGDAAPGDGVTVTAWIWPTIPGRGRQALLCLNGAAGNAWSLVLNEVGAVELDLTGNTVVSSGQPLDAREWYFVAASLDGATRRARLTVCRQRFTTKAPKRFDGEGRWDDAIVPAGTSLLFSAGRIDATPDGPAPRMVFNGKMAAPRLFDHALDAQEIEVAVAGGMPNGLFAGWDFGREAASTRIIDIGPRSLEGRTVNHPARLMTGPFWNGDIRAIGAYDAIHFHNDDMTDAGWPESLRLTIPANWPSGVYALRLRAAADEDHLPFFVCPPRGKSLASIAFLAPTLSYLVYSNESLDVRPTVHLAPLQDMDIRPEAYHYIEEHGLKSAYDEHSDGSGICYASLRRPMLDFRPKARCRTFDAPHQFPADLCLIDWLEEKGFAYDVITDHELHAEGAELLRRYRVIVTGSHPEYWSSPMIDARDDYLKGGGRMMYLGGNGFYWVTGVARDDPSLVEVRRWAGIRTWEIEPGEIWLSLTGEAGGLWRDHGHNPQKSVGVGFCGMGFDRGAPYRRRPASFAPEFAFAFAGVASETVGAGPSLVLNHGAVGFEVDRADADLGTPGHAVVLASSERLSDAYLPAVEDMLSPTRHDGGGANPRVRADMVFVAYPNGGAVFSVGSIIWTATLSFAAYDGDTSRITANVLRAFASDDWQPPGCAVATPVAARGRG